MAKKFLAELVGTMVLVLMGCGVAVSLSCGVDTASVVGTAMAFGLSVVAMAYTIGGISGCHINPAITLGVWLSKRMSGKEAAVYMVAQVIGAIIGSLLLFVLTSNVCGLEGTGANTCRNRIHIRICARSARYNRRQEGRRQLCRSGHRPRADTRSPGLHPLHRNIG